jgi:hypothetical protein
MTCVLPNQRHSTPTHRVAAIVIYSISAVHCLVFLFQCSVWTMQDINGGFMVGVKQLDVFRSRTVHQSSTCRVSWVRSVVFCNYRILMLPIHSSSVTPFTLNIFRITAYLNSVLGSFSLGNCGTRSCLQDSVLSVVHLSDAFLHNISWNFQNLSPVFDFSLIVVKAFIMNTFLPPVWTITNILVRLYLPLCLAQGQFTFT